MKTHISDTASLAAGSGSIWRQCVTQCVCMCRRQQWRRGHYHNKVSLAPFFHQAPVPHVLISHGDPRDHTLVQLRAKDEKCFIF